MLGTLIVLAAWRRRATAVAIAALLLVALHTFLLVGLGFDLTPGGNIQRALDLTLLKGHLWKQEWDPEGIVSTLTALATMLTGTLAGFVLVRKGESDAARCRRAAGALLAWGAAAIAAGLAWSAWIPINKSLWTGSYVAFTSGCACAALALSIVVVDLEGWLPPRGFFLTFGRNPLVAFVGSGLLTKSLDLVKLAGPGGKTVSLQGVLYDGGFSWIADPTLRSHAFALATIVLWWGALLVFERKGWYWKI